ncbi:uncharacterized protein EI90DRAFT_3018898 [Cantharellus anzutake]|uniref:uncharacterized protein n=1 Tax=Cantharellus anzutake TaxID=1750568 RepID=UPI0019042BD1|nr:uncharacterized protein EI90DRAFT_3018898 [Cantharellus anzutake]KAF8325835.1 hypothetical protein EI90DRAFT_3018898 [Cantharellus anzutake]
MSATSSSTETVIDWDEAAVNEWLATLGFTQYQQQIFDHGISGEILCLLDHDGLREVGVHSVGQRLTILREVYHLKVAHGVPIEPEHYVPPSEVIETADQEGVSLDRLHGMIHELAERTRILEEENRKLYDSLQLCIEEMTALRISKFSNGREPGIVKQPSFRWADYSQPTLSPTRAANDTTHEVSPRPSPQKVEHDPSSMSSHARRPPQTAPVPAKSEISRPTIDRTQSNPTLNPSTPSASKLTQSRDASSSSSSTATPTGENQFKSFKVSLDDPCWKVLPAALKKYKISDDWRQYVMFICYGSTERCLSYDEKPLLLFQKLKDANKNPVFMLRHIKDIRSPIAVAQQKQSMRIREAVANNLSQLPKGANAAQNAVAAAPYSRNTRLHQPPVLHPVSVQAQAVKAANAQNTNGGGASWPETADSQPDSSRGKIQSGDEPSPHPDVKDSLAAAAGGTSYAIAIYPYLAEQDDEFNVVVRQGWWIVQKDPSGEGVIDDKAPKGWVPAGCLLETHVPTALAISEAKAANSPSRATGLSSNESPATAHKSPILPSKIISTSFPGIALMNYPGRGEHELTLARGDVLRVFKRYNHWSYAIGEDTGDRGWVPSWFVGKYTPGTTLPSSSIVPPTPTGTHVGESSTDSSEIGERSANGNGLLNGSPLSPAFTTPHTKGGSVLPI